MSINNKDGKGNLLISYLFHNKDCIKQIDEENELKNEITKLLDSKGYKFVIADDDLINDKLVKGDNNYGY